MICCRLYLRQLLPTLQKVRQLKSFFSCENKVEIVAVVAILENKKLSMTKVAEQNAFTKQMQFFNPMNFLLNVCDEKNLVIKNTVFSLDLSP
jgi:hypothetical protein